VGEGNVSSEPVAPESAPPSRLARRLGMQDAVVVGLGSMIGAGVFAAFAPAAKAAGAGLLLGLVLAGIVAYCNATSSARLAAVYPESGGAYVYGRRRLGRWPGFLAGWGFVAGKLASCTAIALTFGRYVAPSLARPLAVAAVIGLTLVNLRGIGKTAALTRVLVVVVLGALAVFVVAALVGSGASGGNLVPLTGGGGGGVLRAAGFLFFAFAGYARIATLGEEVVDPRRTIPRAITVALGLTLIVYGIVAVVALAAVGPATLAATQTPLKSVLEAGTASRVTPVVQVGAAVASLGVLLSLLAGVSRTTFAMAQGGELPRWLGAVEPVRRVPHHAELVIGAVVAVAVALGDIRNAIGFSSFCVLVYYAIANLSALTLRARVSSRLIPAIGLAGCLALAFALPVRSVVAGAAVLTAGLAARVIALSRRGPPRDRLTAGRPTDSRAARGAGGTPRA
jgi:APA family basic amino acid/polyamine antiporter